VKFLNRREAADEEVFSSIELMILDSEECRLLGYYAVWLL
jgi:hypothetical protein